MKKSTRISLVCALGLLVSGTLNAKAPSTTAKYNPVTDKRLANPEPENWLQWRGNYEGWTYSPLDQINSENIADLVPAWSYSTGELEGHQAPPIVNDGMMFVSTPNNKVLALDARNGNEIWSYQKEIPEELFQLHPTNRGVGLYGENVYLAATDACMVALDAKTGKQKWETCVADWKEGYYMTLSPLIAEGKVLVGASGGEYGIRGFVVALDAESGKELWRTHTIPAPGEPGHETWPKDSDAWKRGGAPVWIAGTYDTDLKMAFFGTGNGGPWMPDARPGDNLYANSVLALDIDTGKMVGYHQYHWNDAWDWDEVSPPVIIDYEKDGKKIKGLIHAGRNGYLWTLERSKDGIKFVEAEPFVYQNVFTSIDSKTGRPTYNPDMTPGTNKKVTFCPSLWGGKDWPPEAYNPKTGLFYIPAHENLCSEMGGAPVKYKKGELYIGVPIDEILTNIRLRPGAKDHIGEIQAWDLSKGEKVWTHKMKEMNWGPILTTGGNLVFSGGSNDRKFRALDAKTGKKLWEYRASSGVTAVPSSYMVDGVQYIAVQSGWGVDAQRMQGAFDAVMDHKTIVPQGGVINVFALKKSK